MGIGEDVEVVRVSAEDMEQIQVFLAELEYLFGDLVHVPWMVA